jgi:hypothetical protein
MINENPSGLNTNIYKNVFNKQVSDLSFIGQVKYQGDSMEFTQERHNFQPGDVLYYDAVSKKFDKALAINTVESELCGVVCEIVDVDTFVLTTSGYVKLDKYQFDIDKPLYLSENVPGKLQSIAPVSVVKQIATQSYNGIIVDIQRGFKISDTEIDFSLEPYTQEELDEIIKNVW